MDSNTLREMLTQLQMAAKTRHTIGVYSAENLPTKVNKPAAIIVHSHNSKHEIGHWLAIYLTSQSAYYFDSYGLKPYVDNHVNFIARNASNLHYNKKCYQAPASTVCGGYCLIFLAGKMGVIKEQIKLVEGNYTSNDNLVADTTKNLMNALFSACGR
jgi:hypothetical protein